MLFSDVQVKEMIRSTKMIYKYTIDQFNASYIAQHNEILLLKAQLVEAQK